MYVCMYVCLFVTGLRLKYTSVRIFYVPSGTCPSWCARAHDTMEDLEERRRHHARERVQRYRKHLSDERRQYNSERRRLAQSNSLCPLMALERDRQRTANSTHVPKIVNFVIISAQHEAHHAHAHT